MIHYNEVKRKEYLEQETVKGGKSLEANEKKEIKSMKRRGKWHSTYMSHGSKPRGVQDRREEAPPSQGSTNRHAVVLPTAGVKTFRFV